MDFEKDYIMRLIHQIVEFVIRLVFQKEEREEVREEDYNTELLKKLLSMAGKGQVNEAENLLYDELARGGKENLKLALLFYDGINELSEEELEAQGYSREEIYQGLKAVLEQYGFEGIAESIGEQSC